MPKVFMIDGLNLTLVGKDFDSQVIMQFDEGDNTQLHPGTDSLVEELDGNICVMDAVSFRAHILKGMALLSVVDPLFRELLNCEPEDTGAETLDSPAKEPYLL